MYNKNGRKEERELYKNIGNRLLIRRRELSYTQEQMAELLGVSTGFYGMIERGEKAPSLEKLIIIYEKLGIDITYLLTKDKNRVQIVNYIDSCSKDKQHVFEQLMKCALKLADTQMMCAIKIDVKRSRETCWSQPRRDFFARSIFILPMCRNRHSSSFSEGKKFFFRLYYMRKRVFYQESMWQILKSQILKKFLRLSTRKRYSMP